MSSVTRHATPRRATNHRPIVLAVLSAFLACLLSASPAGAARGHVFARAIGWGVLDGKAELQTCTAEQEPCKRGIAGSGKGQFNEPDGVAVNEASEDFYVVDKGNDRVQYFTAAGAWAGEITGPSAAGTGNLETGSATVKAATAATGAFSVGEGITGKGLPPGTTITAVEPGVNLTISNAATETNEGVEVTAHQAFSNPEQIAIDNACKQQGLTETSKPKTCKEVDPSSGDVYVQAGNGTENRIVDKFTSTGEFIGPLALNAGFEIPLQGQIHGVAVDRAGNLWVSQEGAVGPKIPERFYKFTSAVVNEAGEPPFVDEAPNMSLASGFAVDSLGNFYSGVVEGAANPPFEVIGKFNPKGKLVSNAFDEEPASSVTTELPSNDVYVDNISKIRRFDAKEPNGAIESFGEGHLGEGSGVAVDSASREGQVYVADKANSDVVEFPLEPPGPPTVEHAGVTNVTAESADLQAEVNPRGATTSYQLEYGPCSSPSTCKESPYETKLPEGTIGAPFDFEPHTVGAHAQGLLAATTYHFRLVAHNEKSKGGVTLGEERVFTTQPAGFGFQLPDGRNWELVSPADKHGALISSIHGNVIQAAARGDAMTYVASSPTEAEPEGYANTVQALALRTKAGWSSRDIALPHEAATGASVGLGNEYRSFSEDLSRAAVRPFSGFVPSISPEATEQTPYVRTNFPSGNIEEPCTSLCYAPVVTSAPHPFGGAADGGTCPPKPVCGPAVLGASPDGIHVVIRATVGLTETPGDNGGLYEWSQGAPLTLVSVLPSGKPGAPEWLGSGGQVVRHAISADGDRIVWSGGKHLYLREVSEERTLELDKGLSGTPQFQTASADDSKVFFLEETGSARDLYVYDTSAEKAERLTAEGETLPGGVIGVSEDGSYLYFVADTSLAKGAVQSTLYEMHREESAWHTHAVTVLAEADSGDWGLSSSAGLTELAARVSPTGRYLAFMSSRSLTGYDNRDVATGKPAEEVYEFSVASGTVVCASCNPTGARPVAVSYKHLEEGLAGGVSVWQPKTLIAANVPGWTPNETGGSQYQSRYLSDSGRLFFNSSDALSPTDGNGTEDVYEFEPVGVGGEHPCTTVLPTDSAAAGGCISLISSGTSGKESAFLDASETGGDVFFLTSAQLSKRDTDTAIDVYDAHECTAGSPCTPEPAEPLPPCTTETSCKAPPTPQPEIFGAPSSATFSGPGNLIFELAGAATPPRPRPLTTAQKLSKALVACRKQHPHSKSRRAECERQARKRYVTSTRKHR